MAVDVVRDFEVCKASTCPLVLRIAPVARSRTMLAFTPGFFDKRPSFSSRASGPLTYKFVSHMERPSHCDAAYQCRVCHSKCGVAALVNLAYQLQAWLDRRQGGRGAG